MDERAKIIEPGCGVLHMYGRYRFGIIPMFMFGSDRLIWDSYVYVRQRQVDLGLFLCFSMDEQAKTIEPGATPDLF